MDKVKKHRTVQRCLFTKQYNSLKQYLEENKPQESRGCFSSLEQYINKISALDEEIMGLMLDDESISEEDLSLEASQADEYMSRFNLIKVKVFEDTSVHRSNCSDDGSVTSKQSVSTSVVPNTKNNVRLPKLEISKFSGEITGWFPFWNQFERINNDDSILTIDKFYYLRQAIVPDSRAWRIVDSFPTTEANYPLAVTALKERFGREDLLIDVYIRELLSLTLPYNKTNNLSEMYDRLECKLRALEVFGVTKGKCAAILCPLLESCMNEEFLRVWQRTDVCNETITAEKRLEKFMHFMKSEVQNEERISAAVVGFGSSLKGKDGRKHLSTDQKRILKHSVSTPTATDLLTVDLEDKKHTKFKNNCIFCNDERHVSADCYKARDMLLSDRVNLAKKHRCCLVCLKGNHFANKCKSRQKCPLCDERHVMLLCPKYKKSVDADTVSGSKPSLPAEENTLANLTADKVILPTLMVKVNGHNSERIVRAVFDTGSQRSYILKSLAEEMNYKHVGEESIIHSLFGGEKTGICKHNIYKIHLSSIDNEIEYKCNFDVLDQDTICGELPILDQQLVSKLGLTDSGLKVGSISNISGPVEVLIGADVGGKLLTGNIKPLKLGLTGMETKLGWVLFGKFPFKKPSISNAMIVTSMFVDNLNISELWKLDLLGISDPSETKTKNQVQAEVDIFFKNTLTINSEGRYEVKLPWKENQELLRSNFELSSKRLENTITNLKKDGLYEAYDQVLSEWENEGVIEQVLCSELDNARVVHYLPHRHVVKENSTTKLRPVFDASAHVPKYPSLNDCLHKGSNLIEQIPTLLLKFRLKRIGVVADIRRAFLQISVSPEDRDSLRFLWRNHHGIFKIYRHRRVVFGVVCSPYHLGAVLSHHLSTTKEKCGEDEQYISEILEKLMNSFYVDNLITSVENQGELQVFRSQAIDILAKGKFDLRNWESTDRTSESDGNCLTDVLGLVWDRKEDVLYLNSKIVNQVPEKITKRTILSFSHTVFDPIGFSCPVTLEPKIILRELWSSQSDWDEEVSDVVKDRFYSWAFELKHLSQLKIDRWLLETSERGKYSVHTFCDASANAYAAVVFLRHETSQGVTVQLVQAKVRVAPVKYVTIPRLELLAALIGARLYHSIIHSLPDNCNSYFWSDSSTVLAWIKRDQQWATFVRNRIVEIRNLTIPDRWNHVPGPKNPADLPSRGCTAKQLMQSHWWEGPTWLKRNEEEWPKHEETYDEKEISKEIVKRASSMVCEEYVKSHSNGANFYKYFSSFEKSVRMIAWILRFFKNCKGLKQKGNLSVSEVEEAETKLLKLVQQEVFTDINDSKIKNLQPFQDKNGLFRLKSKISNRTDSEDFRYPILLPKGHVVVERLIMENHLKRGHVGTQILLAILRERFWILGGRRMIRSVISKCIHCKRHSAKALKVSSPPLPVDRVREASAFEVIGVDLAGPVYLKPSKKAWICLFTCGVFRAIHLELLLSLSTEDFLQALRRFIARRGRPAVIFSDNGTNFTGMERALNNINWEKVCEFCSVERIKWKLNPPSAPWWGGFFERLVGLVKNILRKVLGKTSLNYTEMETTLCDCESFINSRPLTYMSDDTNEMIAITPSMFTQDLRESGVPEIDLIESNNFERRYKYRMKVKEDLRKRFRSEYLGQLKMNTDSQSCKIKVGNIVLIGNDKSKRMDWILARVIEVLPGKDGVVRLVKLKTSGGTILLRHVHKLYLLLEEDLCNSKTKDEEKSISQDKRIMTKSGRVIQPPSRF